jgi:DNA polymerase sigma
MELPDEADILMRQEILKSILADITGLYPCATLEMFGSSANGFGSKSSDLDICLTIPDHDKVLFTFVLLCVQYDFETEL